MKCPTCGNGISRKEKFCGVCGTYVGDTSSEAWNEEDVNSFGEEEQVDEIDENEDKEFDKILEEKSPKKKEKLISVRDSSGTRKSQYSYENENLLESYIGEDYKLIKKSFFNIWAFLFNWMYVLYRKMYLTGIIGLILSWVVVVFFRQYIWIYLLVVSILLGLIFSPYYIAISKKKVEKIKEEHMNEDDFTLSSICKSKGGVRVLPALLLYGIFLVSIFFSVTQLHISLNFRTKYWKENSENLANCTSLVKSVYRNATMSDRIGEVTNAVCRVVKGDQKEYEVYMKSEKNRKEVYSYYKTEEGYLSFVGDTTLYRELLEKQKNATLSEEDVTKLAEIQDIEKDYQKYWNQSENEEELIKQRRNNDEKLTYILEREEIIR